MTITICADNKADPVTWNSYVQSTPEGCFYQTTHFATMYNRYYEQKPIYISVFRNNIRIGQLLMFVGTPHMLFTEKRMHLRIIKTAARPLLETGIWMYGPLINDRQHYFEILDFMLKWINEKIKPVRGFDNITPPIYADDLDQDTIRKIYEKHGFVARKKATIIRNLTGTSNEHWNNLKKTNRESVLRVQKQGVIVKEVCSERDLKEFYSVLEQTKKRNSITSYPSYGLFLLLWNDRQLREIHKFFFTEHNGHMVSCQLASIFNGVIYQSGISISDYAIQHKLYGNDLLQWYLIDWGIKHGFRVNDMVGYTLEASTKKEENINHFKRRWGNKIIIYYEFSRKKWGHKQQMPQQPVEKKLTFRQRIAALPYNMVLLNQYSYLQKKYSLEQNISYEQLSTLLYKASQANVESHRILSMIENYLQHRNIEEAVQRALMTADIKRIEKIIRGHRELLKQEGSWAKGKLMHILKREIGDSFDGKIANTLIDKELEANYGDKKKDQ